jgi:hypothetical protein
MSFNNNNNNIDNLLDFFTSSDLSNNQTTTQDVDLSSDSDDDIEFFSTQTPLHSPFLRSLHSPITVNQPTTDISNNVHNPISILDLIFGNSPLLPSNNRLRQVLNQSLIEKNKYINVVSSKGKENIKIIKFDPNVHTTKSCPIMFTDFEPDEEIAKLPCGHIFNKDAIFQWLEEESNKCPVCRYELESEEIKKEPVNPPTNVNHPYGPSNRRIGFHQFLNRFYESQEERMIQRAIEQSLLENSSNTNEIINDDDSDDDSMNSVD